METLQQAIERIIDPMASKLCYDTETFYIDFRALKRAQQIEILVAYIESQSDIAWEEIVQLMCDMALPEKVQPLIDAQVKKTLQSYADCMTDVDDYLFA